MRHINKWLLATSLLLIATWSVSALAQRPSRGDRSPGMRGGPPSGGRSHGGGRSSGGPMGFLQRMDTNQNGKLDPDEVQGPARGFLSRLAQESKLDLSRPIPLEAIAKAFEQMRARRSGGGTPGGDTRGGRPRPSSTSSSSSQEMEPLVPGFGEPDELEPVPGFGTLGEQLAVKIEDSDRQEAQRTLGRYDRNHDGILDKNEIQGARWRNDPLQTDRNHDGSLTLNELALRYAVRRNQRSGGSRSSQSSRSRSSSPKPSSSSSSSSNSRTDMIVRMTMSRYDSNHNGVLEKEEWSKFRTDPSAADKNHDSKITKEELTAWMAERMSGRGGDRGSEGRSRWFSSRSGRGSGRSSSATQSKSSSSSKSSPATSSSQKPIRLRTATELLPEGMPEWFAQRDANADGQIMMSEFTTSWSNDTVADFAQFDPNGDGVITAKECLQATEAGAVLGSPSPTTPAPSPSGSSGSSSPSAAVSTTGMSKEMAKYVKYAVGYIKRFDSNSDGVLTKEEWSKMSKDYSGADKDSDGRIAPRELAEFMMNR